MISIIDRYILREVTKSFLAILSVLLLIFTSTSFIKILQKAVSGTISNDVLFLLVALKSVVVLGTVIPPAFFFAVLYAIGRMYRDSEMTALASCGYGFRKVYRAVAFAAAPVAIIVAMLTIQSMPWAENTSAQIYERQETEAEMGSAVAGRFNEFKQGDVLFFAEEMSSDKTKIHNIFVQNRQHGDLGLITAAKGYQYVEKETGDRFVVLQNAQRYVGNPGETEFAIGEMEEVGFRVETNQDKVVIQKREALSTPFLFSSEQREHKSELQNRLLLPLSVFVFSLAGVILSRSMPREGTSGRIVLSILFYTIFLNLQAASSSWMRTGTTPLWLGRWWVYIVVLLLIWVLYLLRTRQIEQATRWFYRKIGR
jgi:lipopolysaccharide export system permease protein